MRILFVCLGNICSSPTAEGVMRALVEEAGLGERIEIDQIEAACEGLLEQLKGSERT